MNALIPILSQLLPIIAVLVVGGLIGLRMLRPFGNRIIDLIEEMSRSRHAILEEERTLQQIRDRLHAVDDRLDTLAERQDFLESLVENRLAGQEGAPELPREERETAAATRGEARQHGDDAG